MNMTQKMQHSHRSKDMIPGKNVRPRDQENNNAESSACHLISSATKALKHLQNTTHQRTLFKLQ